MNKFKAQLSLSESLMAFCEGYGTPEDSIPIRHILGQIAQWQTGELAKLQDAAPDLLEALKEFTETFQRGYITNSETVTENSRRNRVLITSR